MTEKTVRIGELIALPMPYSEVCMHLKIAGQIRVVRVAENGAQIVDAQGKKFSFPILHAEAGIYTRPDGSLYVREYAIHGYYLGVRNGASLGLLVGPFAAATAAEPFLDKAQQVAAKIDPHAFFYAYTTELLALSADKTLPMGRLNALVGYSPALVGYRSVT